VSLDESLFFANPIPMWVYDPASLRFIEVNDAALSTYGYSRDEFLAMSIADIRPPEDVDALRATIARPRPAWQRSGVWRHQPKHGDTIHAEVTSHELTFRGRPAVLVAAYDVTELEQQRQLLRAANEHLERSERRYRELIENLNEIVWSVDLDGVIQYVSHSAERYGYRAEELIGQHYRLIVHPDDVALAEAAMERAVTGNPAEAEYRAIDGQGRVYHVRASSRAQMEDGRPVGITGVLIDITEQRQAQEQLRVAQRLEAVGRLAGGVAHDFNNLLVAINGYAELALSSIEPDNPLHADISEILKAGHRAAGLTSQLLAFSRKQVLHPDTVNLNDIVRGMEPMLRRLIGEDIDFQTRLAPDLRSVRVDTGQIEQVIMNLAVNSRDAMPRGGRLRITTSHDGFPDEERSDALRGRDLVVLSVIDTGHGMDEATKAQIFEPFFSTKPVGQGTGLGLPMVYGFVKQSGGVISVQSAPGSGTTVRIALPRQAATSTVGAEPLARPSRPGTETILLVEDERAVRELVRRVLAAHGYHLLVADRPEQALDACRSYPGTIHLLLTDVVMPRMSGRELAVEATRIRPDMRVQYMSGYSGAEVAAHGLSEPGADALLQKPFGSAELTGAVRRALDAPSTSKAAGARGRRPRRDTAG
jgi:two-component system cell cycle sensor histidine kinase/response regulator CckA